jgi:hypothetical protein
MSSKKHSDNAIDLNKAYEENEIQLKGILGFAIGLFLLIVITFGLMFAFLNVLKDTFADDPSTKNPMAMSDKDRLPPEPRLQLAPGFGVDSEHGRVNLELQAPQAEYRELKKQWYEMWEKGLKDEKTGAVTMMPLEEAVEKFLSGNIKARSDVAAAGFLADSNSYISDSSAGRLASEKRR